LNLSQVLSRLQEISSRGESLAVSQKRIEEQQRCSIDEQRAILSGLTYCLQQTRLDPGCSFPNRNHGNPSEAVSSAIDSSKPADSFSKASRMRSTSKLPLPEKFRPFSEWLPPYGESDTKALLPLHAQTHRPKHNNLLFRKANVRTPRAFNDFIGSLCVGYLNLACKDSSCHDQSCRPKSKSSYCLKYHFPHWFLSYAISVFFQLSGSSGPEIVIRMPKVRPANSDVFYFACTGNIDGMRSLFKSGLASPDDVEYGTGVSALHASLTAI